jgi:hypothetical protein
MGALVILEAATRRLSQVGHLSLLFHELGTVTGQVALLLIAVFIISPYFAPQGER